MQKLIFIYAFIYRSYVVFTNLSNIRYGLVARIPGSHPGGSGSIPGTGTFFSFNNNLFYNKSYNK
jgi:hypothetical protein